MQQLTSSLATRKSVRSEVSHSRGRGSDVQGPRITLMQIRRIVAALEAGNAEKNIAEAEQIQERIVRKVRQLELHRRSQQVSAMGVAVGTMLDHMSQLHRDVDGSVFEEVTEDAA